MPLSAGTRLGSYEILAPLGAGGMGEVYCARDMRLDRQVAIKVLPPQLGDSATALARFEREAKAVAALTHPNILSIFDFGRDATTVFAVMELLDGETLRQKLAAPVPIRKAVDYGVQIARGLAAAHARGIIHRDLKPENVFVTADGRVKILDFGLARQTLAFAAADATASPTIERQTDPGTVLGTVGYMSPEQARGEPGDPRSDLFTLGAVLYELVTGKRAFQRDTAAETLTAILREDPPAIAASSSEVPPGFARVIEHCLEKNPAERFQSASDVAFALENLSGTSTSATRTVASSSTRRRHWLPWSVAAILAVVCAALTVIGFRTRADARPVTRLAIPFPRDIPYALGGSPQRSLAISPDGSLVVYVGSTGAGRRQLYGRSLDRLTIEPIAGSDGAYQPFFSPDGKWIAFFTGTGELRKVSAGGSHPITLARKIPNSQRAFGDWRADNVIVFAVFGSLLQVSGDGGTPSALPATAPSGHQFAQIVPATGDVLSTLLPDSENASPRLEMFRWNTRQESTVMDNASAALVTTSGHLVFRRDEVAMVAPFDAARGTVGPPIPLADAVLLSDSPARASAQLAVSREGTMVYVPAGASTDPPAIGWVERNGAFLESGILPAGRRVTAALSPDGSSAAILLNSRVFLFDMLRHVLRPVDVGNRQPETIGWHRDGKRITLGGPAFALFDPDTGTEARVMSTPDLGRFITWSRDGRTAAYQTFAPNEDIYTISLDAGATPKPFLATPALERNPVISPNGRLMAYTSTTAGDASLRTDVYVIRFPEGTGKVQITRRGGNTPFWSSDGRELFFAATPGVLQSVSIADGDRLQVGETQTLFPLDNIRVFDASPDGRRFLAVRVPPAEAPTQMIVVQNWLQELTRLVRHEK